MTHPNDIKPENIVGVIAYIGDPKEFLTFAKDIAVKIYGKDIPVDAEKHPQTALFRNTATMYIFGTVKGVVKNEIIFVKNEAKKDDIEQRETTGTAG